MLKFISLTALYFLLGCTTARTNTSADELPGGQLFPYGRTALDNEQLELISSASHFAFNFKGTECQVYASLSGGQDHNYLQYELDGVYQKRIRINKNDQQPIVLSAPSPGRHTIKIFKATEAHTGPVFIQKITGKNIASIKPPSFPLIEFIGNSITCGAAADPSEVPCNTAAYHDQHNAYYAYGPRVARALNTNFILSSVSGIGIYRNWNSDGPTMPEVYGKIDFQEQSERQWNFNTYVPKVVSIALGTNDFSGGDGKKPRLSFDSAAFVSNYIRFVQQVKAKYPSAAIALLSSPMLNSDRRTLLQNCITAVKMGVDNLYPVARPVAVYFFRPMQARGCTGHPSVEDHGIMADELVPFFKALL